MALLNKPFPIRDIGQLDRVIEIDNYTPTHNTSGGETPGYTKLANVWAYVDYVTRKQTEVTEGAKETSMQQVHFYIRYRTDVDTAGRVVYNSNNYDIITVEEIGRQQFLRLVTEYRK